MARVLLPIFLASSFDFYQSLRKIRFGFFVLEFHTFVWVSFFYVSVKGEKNGKDKTQKESRIRDDFAN
jgi:hypothetical protein